MPKLVFFLLGTCVWAALHIIVWTPCISNSNERCLFSLASKISIQMLINVHSVFYSAVFKIRETADGLLLWKHFLPVHWDEQNAQTHVHISIQYILWRRGVAAGRNQEGQKRKQRKEGRQRGLLYLLIHMGNPDLKHNTNTWLSIVAPNQSLPCNNTFTHLNSFVARHTHMHPYKKLKE